MRLFEKSRFSGLLAIFLFSILIISGCKNPEQKAAWHFQRAENYIESGQYEDARIELLNTLKYAPEDQDVLVELARVSVKIGDPRGAISAYRRVMGQETIHRDAAVEYTQLLLMGQAYDQAQLILERVSESFPKDLEIIMLLSQSLSLQGENTKALKLARKASTMAPSQAEPLVNLSQVLANMGDLNGAQKVLAQAESQDPDNEKVTLARINLYLRQGRHDLAIGFLDQLRLKFPEEQFYQIKYLELLESTGRYQEAAGIYNEMVEKQDNASLRVRQGKLLLKMNNLDGAAEAWLRAVELNPALAEPKLDLAILWLRQGNTAPALENVNSVLTEDPANPHALAIRAHIMLGEKKFEDAQNDIHLALKESPDRLDWKLILAKAQAGSGQQQGARQTLRDLVELKSDYHEALYLLAKTEALLGSFDEAVMHATALSRHPVYGLSAMWIMGDSILAEGHTAKAEEIYRRANSVFEPHPGTSQRIANTLVRSGRLDEAIRIYQNLLDANPGDLMALNPLVRILLSQGKKDQALRTAAEHTTGRTPIHQMFYGNILEITGNLAAAEKVYGALIDEIPGFSPPYPAYVRVLAKQDKLDQAAGWLRDALEKENRPELRALLGTVYDAQGNHDMANASYRAALEINPDFVPVLNNLAWNLLEDGNLDEALGLAARAVERSPGDPYVRDTYGWILFKQGDADSALRELKTASQALPGHAEIRVHLAEVLKSLGREEEAREHLKIAREIDPNAGFSK